MFLQHKPSGDIIEVLNIDHLYDPCQRTILGRFHCGEEMQDPEPFGKSELTFPSGEPLPHCWVEPDYRLQAA
ncbi:acetyltransferase [Crocosphaera sp. UHCC 0190]|uniref:acetyltransferase n=1 Tax=Crocosphaera sp. UHCC 0190 TaxID=3110246 RepID=UPI002B20F3B8|nr:acetyltransferase [Crocosphaera sp. UHCC 0190]MEA5511155.1 acetyltransferase [Crocosphaera sp. UHCC 0190]